MENGLVFLDKAKSWNWKFIPIFNNKDYVPLYIFICGGVLCTGNHLPGGIKYETHKSRMLKFRRKKVGKKTDDTQMDIDVHADGRTCVGSLWATLPTLRDAFCAIRRLPFEAIWHSHITRESEKQGNKGQPEKGNATHIYLTHADKGCLTGIKIAPSLLLTLKNVGSEEFL